MKLALSIFIISVFVISCNNQGANKFLGKVSIKGISNIYFKIYQEDSFDSSVAIHYEIVDSNDKIISPMRFLTGTSDFDRDDTKDFYAGSYDSIIYLSFLNPSNMYAIFDLKTKKYGFEFSGDQGNVDENLSKKLKSFDSNLKNTFTEN